MTIDVIGSLKGKRRCGILPIVSSRPTDRIVVLVYVFNLRGILSFKAVVRGNK